MQTHPPENTRPLDKISSCFFGNSFRHLFQHPLYIKFRLACSRRNQICSGLDRCCSCRIWGFSLAGFPFKKLSGLRAPLPHHQDDSLPIIASIIVDILGGAFPAPLMSKDTAGGPPFNKRASHFINPARP